MNAVYKTLVAFCVAQMALSLLVLAIYPSCMLILASIRPIALDPDDVCYFYQRNVTIAAASEQNTNNVHVQFHIYHLDACVFLASTFTTVFAIVYVQLRERDAVTYDATESLAAMLTWAFAGAHFAATFGLVQAGAVVPRDTFGLHLALHTLGLLVACGTPPHMPMWTLAAMLLPVGQLTRAMLYACSQTSLVMLAMQLFMDILLFIGHRWDADPTLTCIQNSRLVYMAGCSYIMQMAIILLPRP